MLDRSTAAAGALAALARRPRIGIINLMPRAEQYESLLLAALQATGLAFDVTWIRLASAAYASSDRAHIDRHYVLGDVALQHGQLDGLIVSGAPVELLPFEEVTYWNELSELLRRARTQVRSTLGLCWGALALAKLLTIEKVTFERKLSGIFTLDVLQPEHVLLGDAAAELLCPQSRCSGLAPDALADALSDGRVQLLAASAEAGAVILVSADGRYVMHVGHPEYDAQRLVIEYQRDREAARRDIEPPQNVDLQAPSAPWREASTRFFRGWLHTLRITEEAGRSTS